MEDDYGSSSKSENVRSGSFHPQCENENIDRTPVLTPVVTHCVDTHNQSTVISNGQEEDNKMDVKYFPESTKYIISRKDRRRKGNLPARCRH